MTKDYKYKFSFVIPVYNVENYLAETVESVLAQTMNFEQNCEIIFVNDGSSDKSEEVCLRYKELFPANVQYIKQANLGPGAARNRGILETQGKYISLLDSDDKISPNALTEVYQFFEKHYGDIDLVAIKQIFFEARTGQHPLNYKFTNDRVVDLLREFDQIQMSVTSAFFKQEVLRQFMFEESIGRYAEDSHLLGRILLDKKKFGVVTRPSYFYRKRSDQASSLDTTLTDPFWYLETPKRAWYDLLGYARKNTKDELPKFIQFMIMYDLQWRIKQASQTVLTADEEKQYKTLLYELLRRIDDDVIVSQRYIGLRHKIFALSKKHREDIIRDIEARGTSYYYGNTKIYEYKQTSPKVHIEFVEIVEERLRIEGFFDGLLIHNDVLKFITGNAASYIPENIKRPDLLVTFLGDEVAEGYGFCLEIPVPEKCTIRATVSDTRDLPIVTHRFSRLNTSTSFAYCRLGNLLVNRRPMSIKISHRTYIRHVGYELLLWVTLLKRLKMQIVKEQYDNWRQLRMSGSVITPGDLKWLLVPAKAMARNLYAVCFRACYFVTKPFYNRPIWLISDRVMEADDNGEVFFRYLTKRSDVPARVYFVISKRSSEYNRVKAHGRVVNYHGFFYKLLFLLSDKVISSEASDHIINAFGGRMEDVVDLYNFKFVFLQHGIIKDDISAWLNRYEKNIRLFITSVQPEYQAVLNEGYSYNEDVVKLTGLARYDLLESEPQNKVILAPTWRQHLAGKVDPLTGRRLYNPAFKNSRYFKFYQSLINDPRLQRVMRERNFKGEFYLHHSLESQIPDFENQGCFEIMQMPFDYPKAKKEGNLLVTDYSSIAFDFGYLGKPVLYAQFDESEFYKSHTGTEGYFSYAKNGFGPVTYDYEETIKRLIKMIQAGCKIETKYQERIEKFFAFHDVRNCERIYKAVVEMS